MVTEERIIKIKHPELGDLYKKNRYTYDPVKSWEEHERDSTFWAKTFVEKSTKEEYLKQENGK